jgi:peptidylprolyl isomerase/peptidyl-prolyl cis-trans isomerase D
MGFMQKLRQNMPAVIIFLIVMFVALIIFEWGVQRAGGGARGYAAGQSLGEVNGVAINSTEYEERVADAVKAQRQQNPDADVDEQPIREQIWNQMIDEMLIQQTADRMGIRISNEELKEVLMYDPPDFLKQQFTDSTGYFNQALYQGFMSDIDGFLTQRQFPPEEIQKYKLQMVKIQEAIRKDRLRQAVESVVTASSVPGPAEAFAEYVNQKTKASGTFAMLDANAIPDAQVTISEEEAKKYYDAHKADFQQKASREIRYALFTQVPSAEDSASVTRKLKTVTDALAGATTPAAKDSLFAGWIDLYGAGRYNGSTYTPMQEIPADVQSRLQGAGAGTVIGPVQTPEGTFFYDVVDVKDSGDVYVKAQHILLKTEANKNDDSVKALAEKILQRAKSGENFDALAAQYSADPGSAQRGGDLGYFKKGAMVKPFEEASFAATPGTIVGPVKTDYGYHIIKVNDRSSKSYKLRELKFEPRVSNPTKNLLRHRVQQFHDKLTQGTSIDSLGKREGVQVLESGPVQRTQPVAGSMKLTYFTYEGNTGDVSDVIELPSGALVVGQITKVNAAGVMSFADAKESIMTKLRTQKKLDMLKDRAGKLRASLAAGDSLSKLTSIDPAVQIHPFTNLLPTAPFPGAGFDYPLSAAVFSGKPGELSPLIRGEHGYYIAKVDNLSKPTEQDFAAERDKFIQQLATQRRGMLFQQWLQKERERAEIKDLRSGNY